MVARLTLSTKRRLTLRQDQLMAPDFRAGGGRGPVGRGDGEGEGKE